MATTVIDEGSFAQSALAKAGHDLVREGLSIEGEARVTPLAVEDYEKKFCQATKGGSMPDCRVHVTSAGGTTMALRLCDKTDGPGTVVPVKDAADALETAQRFCKCATKKPVATRKKCARKMQGLSGLDSTVFEVYTPERLAPTMVTKYGGREAAAEAARSSASQYPSNDQRRIYWESVHQLIRRGGALHGTRARRR